MALIQSQALTKKQLYLLGKVLVMSNPQLATELSNQYLASSPLQSDLSNINNLFYTFCHIQDLNPEEYRGKVSKVYKTEQKRLFIAAIIALYQPELFSQPIDKLVLKLRLTQSIAIALKQDSSLTSRMIRDAITWVNTYKWFNEKAAHIVRLMQKEAA